MFKKYFAVFIFALLSGVLAAQINCSPSRTSKGDFALIGGGRAARIFVDASEPACVKKRRSSLRKICGSWAPRVPTSASCLRRVRILW